MVTKHLEVSREGVQLVGTPSTAWLILKHCFVRQREAHMLGVLSFSALFLLPNFGEGAIQRVPALVLSHSAPQQSSKISAVSFCLHVPVLEKENEEHRKKDK